MELQRRIRSVWREGEWLLIATLAVAAVLLGSIGFARHSAAVGEDRSWADLLYLSLQLFVLESGAVPAPVPWELQVARLFAPFVAVYAAAKAVLLLFAEQLQHMRLRRMRDHAVICGGGRKGLALARAFHARGVPALVIERDGTSRTVAGAREAGAALLIGDAADPATLRRARTARARCALVVCDSDATNAEVAVAVKEAAGDLREHPLTCAVHVTDPELCHLLRNRWSASWSEPAARLEFFNLFDRGARAMLDSYPPSSVRETRHAHLLVVGFGRLGESIVLQAAWRWRMERDDAQDRDQLVITVVDREAEKKCAALCARYGELAEVCRVRSLTMDVTSPEFERAEFLAAAPPDGPVTCAYVCLDNDTRSLSAGLALHRHTTVPIVVRSERETGLAALFGRAENNSPEFQTLHVFGLLDRACTPEYALHGTLEALARALHEHYVRHQTRRGDTRASNQSLVSWEVLTEDLKAANRRQAVGLRSVLSAAGYEIEARRSWGAEPLRFSAEEVERLGRAEHERWVSERLSARWRFAPGQKDPRRRTSPHLLPWDELPEDVREIDRAIIRELPVLLADAGYAIQRPESRGDRPAAE